MDLALDARDGRRADALSEISLGHLWHCVGESVVLHEAAARRVAPCEVPTPHVVWFVDSVLLALADHAGREMRAREILARDPHRFLQRSMVRCTWAWSFRVSSTNQRIC